MRAGLQSPVKASTPGPEPLLVRIPLAAAASAPRSGPLPPCTRCGSHGFNVHQREWRRIKDPHCRKVLVLRHVCKRCGHATRSYPVGVGAGRQSDGLRQLSVLLYGLGLSYLAVRSALADLGCTLSCTSIRRNVEEARRLTGSPFESARLHLAPVGGGLLRGRDGLVSLRLEQPSAETRALIVEIAPGPNAAHLRWRLQTGAELVARGC